MEIMAEGLTKYKENILHCGPCKDDGNELPAEGYCVTCAEHLCDMCFKSHTVPRPFKKHVLQDKNEMPKTASNTELKCGTYKCSIHPNEVVTSYCTSHERLCCEKCADISHPVCKSLKPLCQVGENVQESEDFKQFLCKLNSLGEQSESNLAKATSNADLIDAVYNRCIDDFSATMCKIKDKDKSNNRKVQSVSEAVSKQVNTWKGEIKRHQDNNDNNALFVLMKTSEIDAQLMEDNVKQVENENKIETYKFVPVNESSVIGKIMRTPFKIRTITVKHEQDNTECGVRSIAMLDNEKLALSDHCNNSIKILNYNKGTLDAVVKIQRKPWTMAVTKNNELYVNTSGQKKILHFPSPMSNLNDYMEIPVDGVMDYSIHYYNNALKVTFTNPLRIEELGLDGKRKGTIVKNFEELKDDQGQQMLTQTKSSVLNQKNGSVMYTEETRNAIIEIQDNGNARQIVRSKDLNGPCGIVQDVDGSFLVCSWIGKRVLRVTDGGTVPEEITGLTFKPFALYLDNNNRVLYVGGDCDQIHIYQL